MSLGPDVISPSQSDHRTWARVTGARPSQAAGSWQLIIPKISGSQLPSPPSRIFLMDESRSARPRQIIEPVSNSHCIGAYRRKIPIMADVGYEPTTS